VALPDAIVETAIALMRTASGRGLTIAAAESCTGGLLASPLTDIEGASNAFERGFVAYSAQSKCDLLGLSRGMIEDCGAVSEPVARAMAEGALRQSDADIAVAITGFAGPGKPGDEPGLVHFAGSASGLETRHRECHFGDIGRGATRIECLRVALDILEETLAALAVRKGVSHAS
jgi:nicotinamide-nucleotide amidase